MHKHRAENGQWYRDQIPGTHIHKMGEFIGDDPQSEEQRLGTSGHKKILIDEYKGIDRDQQDVD